MKKSRHIQLILITAALAGCHRPNNEWQNGNRTYVRGDSSAPYTQVYHPGVGISPLLWYFAFRPYGNYYNGYYRRAGYYSGALSERGNIGGNSFKGSVVRGGFGRGGFSVSS